MCQLKRLIATQACVQGSTGVVVVSSPVDISVVSFSSAMRAAAGVVGTAGVVASGNRTYAHASGLLHGLS